MGAIFYFSSIAGSDIPSLFAFQDILFHLVIYAILAYFFSRAFKNSYLNFNPLKIIYITVIFGVIYGMTDEWHQTFVAGRYASGLDLFIDGLGSFIGSLIYR
jgi:VanZ family protein